MYSTYDWVPYVFILDKQGDAKTIDGRYVRKLEFPSYQAYYEYCKDNPYIFENKVKPEIQFLSERYYKIPDDRLEVPELLTYTLDIEVIREQGFPDPMIAEDPVVSISITDSLSKNTISFGDKPYGGKGEYVYCRSEVELLRKFFDYIYENQPDVLSGWNCVPLNSFIFGSNKIDTIKDIKDESIIKKYPKSIKEINKIILANGKELLISDEHKIPIVYADSNKYTNFKIKKGKNDWIKKEDIKVKDIPIDKYSCFVEYPINNNLNNDVDINDDILYLCGFIFTDGSLRDKSNKKSGYRIYQSDYELLKTFDNLVETKICGPIKNNYTRSIKYSLISDYGHSLIYDENNNKKLNVKELSKLSYRQFMLFLSGIFDGDGYISDVTLSICNYENQIDNLSILCQWNGIFTTITKNRLRFLDIKFEDLTLRKTKRWNNFKPSILERNSSQKISKINYKKINNKYLIKIKNIIKTKEKTEMMDVQTKTGYFVCNGINVHNCWGFDLPYLINRSKKLFGDDTNIYKLLSPIRVVRMWKSRNEEDMNIDIAGVHILDYMDVYKWYSPNKLEKYSLDFVSKFELDEGKVDYSEFKDLRELYHKDYDKFIHYNRVDCERVDQLENKLGYIRLIQALSLLTKCSMKYYQAMTQLIEGALLTHYRRNNMCAPYFAGGTQEHFQAAYVKEPQKGMHKWVIDIDITSSYPSHIITLNMSNETYFGRIIDMTEDDVIHYTRRRRFPSFNLMKLTGMVEFEGDKLRKFNSALEKGLFAISPCGSIFVTKPKGVIADVEQNIFAKRKEVKDQMKSVRNAAAEREDPIEKQKLTVRAKELFSLQWAIKILLNAVFGITAVPYSRYFNTNIAEAITSCGRHTIRQGEKFVNELLNNSEEYEPLKKFIDKYK